MVVNAVLSADLIFGVWTFTIVSGRISNIGGANRCTTLKMAATLGQGLHHPTPQLGDGLTRAVGANIPVLSIVDLSNSQCAFNIVSGRISNICRANLSRDGNYEVQTEPVFTARAQGCKITL